MMKQLIRTAVFALTLSASASAVFSVTQTFAPDDLRQITNPERGLYSHLEAQSESSPLSLGTLQNVRNNGRSLVLRLYYLKDFRNQPLSQTQLDIIANDFALMRQAGVKSILRFAYSQGIGEADAPLNIVLNHMDQLAPILDANADVIATAQAGFAGAWGEWHSSTNNLTDPTNARQITDKWLVILPPQRAIQVRTPALKKMITQDISALTAGEAFTDTSKARIGHHNDCFLASSTDFGTYTNPAADKAWIGQETQYLPMGGETCNPNLPRSGSTTARAEMQQLHFSYLNAGYHPQVLADWQADGFLDEVKRNLGYRIALNEVTYDGEVNPGSSLSVDLELENTGWASPYNPRDVVLTLVSDDGLTEYAYTLDEDPRTWLPGGAINVSAMLDIPAEAPVGNYHLFFSLPDPMASLADRPEYAIQLANPGLWDPATGRHDLGVTITIGTILEGDLDGDGFVGISDLNLILGNWNQTVAAGDPLAGDPTGDGFVGIEDLNLVLGNWNAGSPPSASTNIPEPSTIVLLGLGTAVLLKR